MSKELAYLIGVFLGDGSVQSDGRTFCLQTIDKDFAEACAKSLRKLSGNALRIVDIPRLTAAKRQVYAVYVSDVSFCRLLLEKTDGRKKIPSDWMAWTPEERKELIAGLLDSEGYVSITRLHEYAGKKVYDMKIGIGACDEWVEQLHSYCRANGILTGGITIEKLPSDKDFKRFVFNKKSFLESGLYFKIGRKQGRINEYQRDFPGSTTTRGIPKTKETKDKMAVFARTRDRVGGRFVKVMI